MFLHYILFFFFFFNKMWVESCCFGMSGLAKTNALFALPFLPSLKMLIKNGCGQFLTCLCIKALKLVFLYKTNHKLIKTVICFYWKHHKHHVYPTQLLYMMAPTSQALCFKHISYGEEQQNFDRFPFTKCTGWPRKLAHLMNEDFLKVCFHGVLCFFYTYGAILIPWIIITIKVVCNK